MPVKACVCETLSTLRESVCFSLSLCVCVCVCVCVQACWAQSIDGSQSNVE